ncbi:MAG TPA: hypothetical protein VHO03_20495 [Ignavibacteriales bacterium]|nr:hypothetical protein [Ignavibacteriales bacterium]
MERKHFFAAAVLILLITVSGCSEVTPPELNNPLDPLSSAYKVPVPNLTVSFRGTTAVLLQWANSWSYESGLNVERSVDGGPFEKIAKLPKGTKTYIDSGLDPGKGYSYRVNRFTDMATSLYSRTVELTPGLVSYLDVITTEGTNAAAFSHDGSLLATSHYYYGSSTNITSEIKLWEAPFDFYGSYIHGNYKNITAMAFSPNDQLLAGGCEDGTVCVWDVKTKALLQTIMGVSGQINALEFSPDGNFLAVAPKSNNILIIDTKSWTTAQTLSKHAFALNSLTFSRDGSILASASDDGTIVLWNTSRWAVSRVINTQEPSVKSVAFRPDGQVLAAAAGMNYYQFEVSTGNLLKKIQTGGQNALSAAFLSDGKTFACCCGTALSIYDADFKPYSMNYNGWATKMFAYNRVIPSPKDAIFLSLGYPASIWAPGAWTVSYK